MTYHNGKTGLWVLIATALIVITGLFWFASKDWQRFLPRPGDLATSPVTRELAKKNEEIESEHGRAIVEQTEEKETGEIGHDDIRAELEGNSENISVVPRQPSTGPESDPANIIVIPGINITAPLIIASDETDATKLKALLDDGAIVYPDSVLFGQKGQTIVLGHSAPPNWPEIKHDTIFSRLSELGYNDKIIAVYNDKTYTYKVVHNEIIEKGGNIPRIEDSDNELVLVTCWPPGRDLKRMIVQASLESIE